LFELDRLADVTVHADPVRADQVLMLIRRCQNDDRIAFRSRILAKALQDFKPVNLR